MNNIMQLRTFKNIHRLPGNLGRYLILITLSLIIMAPVFTAVSGSLRTNGDFLSKPFALPHENIQWQHYTGILEDNSFWQSAVNSLLITAGVTVLNISLASLLAFAFSRIKFFGREIVFNILSIGLLFPVVVALLPVFIQVRDMGLINNLWGVIFPLVAFGLPGSVIILRTFFRAVPIELEDAAYIDGCTRIGFFRFILLPLARPAIASVATLQIIAGWNEYFLPLLVLTDPKKWPLPLGVMQYQGQFGTDWARVMAYVTILIIPAVFFYLMTEKYIVTGLTGGELKG
ncbi:MAG: carbohydrate ABC transporter permease [Chloroflexi bacterium]|nr:carbohydrate ABC transporter permease [Chloroflexota bacterium]